MGQPADFETLESTIAAIDGYRPKGPFPLFIKDLKEDTIGWEGAARWRYLCVLEHMFHKGGYIPDDLAYLAPPMSFRFCRPGDSFLDLAKDPPRDDPPASGEVIYADSEKTLCRRWNWRQDARSRIREETSQATVVIQTLEDPEGGRLEAAAAAFAAHVSEDLGARCRWTIADRANPEVGPV